MAGCAPSLVMVMEWFAVLVVIVVVVQLLEGR
jgi:hypothetical protein